MCTTFRGRRGECKQRETGICNAIRYTLPSHSPLKHRKVSEFFLRLLANAHAFTREVLEVTKTKFKKKRLPDTPAASIFPWTPAVPSRYRFQVLRPQHHPTAQRESAYPCHPTPRYFIYSQQSNHQTILPPQYSSTCVPKCSTPHLRPASSLRRFSPPGLQTPRSISAAGRDHI